VSQWVIFRLRASRGQPKFYSDTVISFGQLIVEFWMANIRDFHSCDVKLWRVVKVGEGKERRSKAKLKKIR
jgi:hypothetical protein